MKTEKNVSILPIDGKYVPPTLPRVFAPHRRGIIGMEHRNAQQSSGYHIRQIMCYYTAPARPHFPSFPILQSHVLTSPKEARSLAPSMPSIRRCNPSSTPKRSANCPGGGHNRRRRPERTVDRNSSSMAAGMPIALGAPAGAEVADKGAEESVEVILTVGGFFASFPVASCCGV